MITKGGSYGWVKAFTVYFGNTKNNWLLVKENGAPKEFTANSDSITAAKLFFNIPIRARYLKIVPTHSTSEIEMKVEILGCFKEYRELLFEYIVLFLKYNSII